MNLSSQYMCVGLKYHNTHSGADFKGMWSHRACTQKAPTFGVILCHCNLEIINNVVFGFVFCKWNLMGQWIMSVGRRDTCSMYVCCFLSLHPYVSFKMLYEHRIPMDPWCLGQRLSPRLLVLSKQGAGRPRGHAFYSNQNFFEMQKMALVFREAQMTQEPYLFYSCCSLVLDTKCWKWQKKKDRATYNSFSFQFFSFFGKNEIRMHVWATEYKLNNFDDLTYN